MLGRATESTPPAANEHNTVAFCHTVQIPLSQWPRGMLSVEHGPLTSSHTLVSALQAWQGPMQLMAGSQVSPPAL